MLFPILSGTVKRRNAASSRAFSRGVSVPYSRFRADHEGDPDTDEGYAAEQRGSQERER
jgi:hypothetical protein